MHGNEFSLQLNEAKNNTSNKDAYLICYVRFIDNDGNIVKALLFCKLILKNCRAHELFAIANNFFQENNLQWKYCVGLCTDGAQAMSDRFGGLRTLVQGVTVNVKRTHCLILVQREALASLFFSAPCLHTHFDFLLTLPCVCTIKFMFVCLAKNKYSLFVIRNSSVVTFMECLKLLSKL